MFEAADPEVFAWYVKSYGPEVNLFVDHSQIVQLECLRGGLGHPEPLGSGPDLQGLRRPSSAAEAFGHIVREPVGRGSLVRQRFVARHPRRRGEQQLVDAARPPAVGDDGGRHLRRRPRLARRPERNGRPGRSAAPSFPSMRRPVNISSFAALRPIRSGSRTDIPQIGAMPNFPCVSLNTADSPATMRSQPRTSSRPPVKQWPFTLAITGCGSASRASIVSAWYRGVGRLLARGDRSEVVAGTERTPGSRQDDTPRSSRSAQRSRRCARAARRTTPGLSAFSLSGRFSVIVTTPSASSRSTSSVTLRHDASSFLVCQPPRTLPLAFARAGR